MKRPLPLLALLSLATPALADPVLTLEGAASAGGPDHLLLPFSVPAGTAEIEVRHRSGAPQNVLDFGLLDPAGYRGWGGGTSEPALVGVQAASRAYVPGPLPAGTWQVIVGKAQLAQSPAPYRVEIELRERPTLPPQPERRPYAPVAALRGGRRYYAGDLHVHSRESTDARPALGQIVDFARSRGLDFVEISDHNTITQLDFFAAEQARQPALLLLPGIEYTTYQGHANAIGATRFVDHKIGQPGVTIEGAADAIRAQGALLSINHPALDVGSLCIGCAWRHELAPDRIDAVEIGTGGLRQGGFLFVEQAIALWDALCDRGAHVAPVGGSDDHSGGTEVGMFKSVIGSPTTLVLADELSAAAIVDGVRRGRTVVKLQDPADPMVELAAEDGAVIGDTIRARSARLLATIRGGAGARARFVRNGEPQEELEIGADPFVLERSAEAPAAGEDRWRVEVLVDGERRTVTGHLYVAAGAAAGCAAAPGGRDPAGAALALAALLVGRVRRRRAGTWRAAMLWRGASPRRGP